MGLDDKIKNEAEEAKGRGKQWVGDKTDDEELEAEGMTERAKAKAKQAGEHVKDAARDARDTFRR
jgi:uncharacterized protein YjbJ (UPF0337 family)